MTPGDGEGRTVWVSLVTVHSSFEARLLCAHLAAEGIPHQTRGTAEGPYRFTVGPMAEVQILVRREDREIAEAVIAGEDPEDSSDPGPHVSPGSDAGIS